MHLIVLEILLVKMFLKESLIKCFSKKILQMIFKLSKNAFKILSNTQFLFFKSSIKQSLMSDPFVRGDSLLKRLLIKITSFNVIFN